MDGFSFSVWKGWVAKAGFEPLPNLGIIVSVTPKPPLLDSAIPVRETCRHFAFDGIPAPVPEYFDLRLSSGSVEVGHSGTYDMP